MVMEKLNRFYRNARRVLELPRNNSEYFLKDIDDFRKRKLKKNNEETSNLVYLNVFSRGFGFMIENGDYKRDIIQQNLTLLASYSENKEIYLIKSFGLINYPISGDMNFLGNEKALNARAEFLGIKRKIENHDLEVKVNNIPDFLKWL